MKTAILTVLMLPLLAMWAAQAAENKAKPEGAVSIRDFADRAVDGDWSPAIQAAIDHITAANGYENGATVFFPPGIYKVNRTVVLGKDPAHYGTRLSGYGAVLVGTETLDAQPAHYEKRKRGFEEEGDRFSLQALPGELDFDGKTHVGIAILELWDPPGQEGASYVIEGLAHRRYLFRPAGLRSSGQGVHGRPQRPRAAIIQVRHAVEGAAAASERIRAPPWGRFS